MPTGVYQRKIPVWNKGKKGLQIAWNKGKHTGFKPWLGKKRSLKDRKKMSDTAKRIGKIPPSQLGVKQSPETIEKRIAPLRGRKRPLDIVMKSALKRRGENHWNWKGGTSNSADKVIRRSMDYKLWRNNVFTQDDYTCQKYGIKGGRLHPHHIQNFAQYPELRFSKENGITLSEKAHKEFHHIYGTKNNTREQIEEFIGRKL